MADVYTLYNGQANQIKYKFSLAGCSTGDDGYDDCDGSQDR